MEKDISQNSKNQNNSIDQDAILNRVNQTFDKIAQDVRNMIDENEQTTTTTTTTKNPLS
jgi:adenylosuccinate lyase